MGHQVISTTFFCLQFLEDVHFLAEIRLFLIWKRAMDNLIFISTVWVSRDWCTVYFQNNSTFFWLCWYWLTQMKLACFCVQYKTLSNIAFSHISSKTVHVSKKTVCRVHAALSHVEQACRDCLPAALTPPALLQLCIATATHIDITHSIRSTL